VRRKRPYSAHEMTYSITTTTATAGAFEARQEHAWNQQEDTGTPRGRVIEGAIG